MNHFEISGFVKADLMEKRVEHNAKIRANSSGESPLILGVHEKLMHRKQMAVPRSNTGVLAEKAKTCKEKLVKGTRQIGHVSSVEMVSTLVSDKKEASVDLSNKERPTVYQKRNQVLCRKALYTW